MKQFLKKMKNNQPKFYSIILRLSTFIIRGFNFKKRIKGSNNSIICKSALIKKSILKIKGNNNEVFISPECFLTNCTIFVSGNNNKIYLNQKVKLFDTELWIEDENNSITIGKSTSINGAHIAVTEYNHKIKIGDNCLFSKDIDIWNGDSHSIIDLDINKRINYAGDIKIGNHVWLGKFVKILKGSIIEDNSIIGINSLVNSKIEKNCLAVGSPAKVIKRNMTWKHERIYNK